jgi:hypothetical protein
MVTRQPLRKGKPEFSANSAIEGSALALPAPSRTRCGRHSHASVGAPCLRIETAQRLKPVVIAEFRLGHRSFEHRNGLVVNLCRHGERMAVLAAMRQREAGGIVKAAGRAMHQLGHQRQRPHRARPDAGNEQQVGEVGRASVGGGGQRAVQAAQHHILRTDVVVFRHDEMGQQRLGGRLVFDPLDRGCFA